MGKLNICSPIYCMNDIERIDLILDTHSRQNLPDKPVDEVVVDVQTNKFDHQVLMYSIICAHHKTAQ